MLTTRSKILVNSAILCAAVAWTSCAFAQTIKPYHATPVQPYQSGQVQEYHSTPVPEYHSSPQAAVNGSELNDASPSSSGTSFDGLSWSVPAGWQALRIKSMMGLLPQDTNDRKNVIILIAPPKALEGKSIQSVFATLDRQLGSKDAIEQETPVQALRTSHGAHGFYRAVRIRPSHGGNFQFYTIFQQGSSMRTVIFMAASRALYDRYKSDFANFLDSVAISDDSEPATTPVAPSPRNGPLRTSGNLVEPLSNGLRLSMNCDDIQNHFGPPPHPTWDARTFGYDDFGLICGGAGNHIWTLTLTGHVRLHSGIGVGSSRSDVMRVFGEPISVTSGQYKLHFDYNGDRVSHISISPAYGTFRASNNEDGAGPRHGASQDQSEQRSEQNNSSAGRFVGTWQGLTVPGQIVIRANGTYGVSGHEGGRYRVSGNDIYFDGELLRAWDHGHATLSRQGNLEFYWTNPDGSKNYFAFGR